MGHTWRRKGVIRRGKSPDEDATQTTEWCRAMSQRASAVGGEEAQDAVDEDEEAEADDEDSDMDEQEKGERRLSKTKPLPVTPIRLPLQSIF
jgi:hypothetical protein